MLPRSIFAPHRRSTVRTAARGAALLLALATPALAHAGPACALLSRAEAERLLGAPVAAPVEHPPKAGGGGVISTCRYLPADHRPDDAMAPPRHGLALSVHVLDSPALARRRYDWSQAQAHEIRSAPQGPAADDRIETLGGVGETAFSIDRDGFGTAQVYALKGHAMLRVEAWKATGSATRAGVAAARQALERLP